MKPIACGSKEFNLPLSRFPLAGASRGHRRLRCAAARAQHRPKAKRSSAFWAGKEEPLFSWVLRPQPPLSLGRRTVNCMLQTGHFTC